VRRNGVVVSRTLAAGVLSITLPAGTSTLTIG
jgi:hypothetical protein